ncbi:MAG: hypothetical protein MUD01_29275 [Chloroflexaceae bacterium]|jgi:hypothetical protein|nr:hypothetical protein [Chloroflexaceae bacterium]
MTSPSDDIGEARTVILRLRREPGSATWRGQAICVQTGVAVPLHVQPNSNADIAQLHALLQTLLAEASDGSPTA